jgi:1,4-dihydroxy-2-naphthoate octaprenyltransferase
VGGVLCLVNDLLLLNQFPDAEADETVGRKHLPIVVGKRASSLVYGAFLLAAYLSIIVAVLIGYLPQTALLVLVSVPLAVIPAVNAYRYAEDLERLMPSLGLNVLLNIVAPVLLSVGLFLG